MDPHTLTKLKVLQMFCGKSRTNIVVRQMNRKNLVPRKSLISLKSLESKPLFVQKA